MGLRSRFNLTHFKASIITHWNILQSETYCSFNKANHQIQGIRRLRNHLPAPAPSTSRNLNLSYSPTPEPYSSNYPPTSASSPTSDPLHTSSHTSSTSPHPALHKFARRRVHPLHRQTHGDHAGGDYDDYRVRNASRDCARRLVIRSGV
jgi:hypothetical protein